MKLGRAYFRLRYWGLMIPLIAGAAIIGVRAVSGVGKVHFYLPPDGQASATLDGNALELPGTGWHHVVELPRGKHRISVTAFGEVTDHDVEVSLFKEFLIAAKGQCFFWLVEGPRIAERYDGKSPIEVPAGTLIGVEEATGAQARPAAIFIGIDCDELKQSDTEILSRY